MNPLEKLLDFHRKGLKFDRVQTVTLAQPKVGDKTCLVHSYKEAPESSELFNFLETTASSACRGCYDGVRIDGLSVHKWVNFLRDADEVKEAFKNGVGFDDYHKMRRLDGNVKRYRKVENLQEYAQESVSLIEEFKKEVGDLNQSKIIDLIIERHSVELRRRALKGVLVQPGFYNASLEPKENREFKETFTPSLLTMIEKFEEEAFQHQENLTGLMMVSLHNGFLSQEIRGNEIVLGALKRMYCMNLKEARVYIIPEGLLPLFSERMNADGICRLKEPLTVTQKEIFTALMNENPQRDLQQTLDISLNV